MTLSKSPWDVPPRDERIKQKIKSIKDNQRINASIYKDNIKLGDIIHNTPMVSC
jgi:hypothetical protein